MSTKRAKKAKKDTRSETRRKVRKEQLLAGRTQKKGGASGCDGSECTGHCCQKFFLPHSPEELKAAYMHWVKTHQRTYSPQPMMKGQHAYGARDTLIIDIHLIYPMVRHLGQFDKTPFREVVKKDNKGAHYYTCIHWDKKSRKCTIYEIRPQMCREYPYAGACNYAACTWEEKKQKPRGQEDEDDELLVKAEEGPGTMARLKRVRQKVLANEGFIE